MYCVNVQNCTHKNIEKFMRINNLLSSFLFVRVCVLCEVSDNLLYTCNECVIPSTNKVDSVVRVGGGGGVLQ